MDKVEIPLQGTDRTFSLNEKFSNYLSVRANDAVQLPCVNDNAAVSTNTIHFNEFEILKPCKVYRIS